MRKTRTHGLDEREMELVKLLIAEYENTADIQVKLKKLFAENNTGNSRNSYGRY